MPHAYRYAGLNVGGRHLYGHPKGKNPGTVWSIPTRPDPPGTRTAPPFPSTCRCGRSPPAARPAVLSLTRSKAPAPQRSRPGSSRSALHRHRPQHRLPRPDTAPAEHRNAASRQRATYRLTAVVAPLRAPRRPARPAARQRHFPGTSNRPGRAGAAAEQWRPAPVHPVRNPVTVVYRDSQITVVHGNCLTVLPELGAESVERGGLRPAIRSGAHGTGLGPSLDRLAYPHNVLRRPRRCPAARTPRQPQSVLPYLSMPTRRAMVRVLRTGVGPRTARRSRGVRPLVWPVGHGVPACAWTRRVSGHLRRRPDLAPAGDRHPGQRIPDPRHHRVALRTGPPQNHDVGKAVTARQQSAPVTNTHADWQGWGTALKPAFELIIVARKNRCAAPSRTTSSLTGSGRSTSTRRTCTPPTVAHATHHPPVSPRRRRRRCHYQLATCQRAAPAYTGRSSAGRSPPNVLLGHSPHCARTCALGYAVDALDTASGTLVSGANPRRRASDRFGTVYGHLPGDRACLPSRGGGPGRRVPVLPSVPVARQSQPRRAAPRDGRSRVSPP